MENPKISVIVPVYKVEAYLDKCVQSIVDQTYRNLEIILVDDGSPDNCGAMCDAWAEKDSRIRVIHKENGGLSDARNAGMAVAAGEYMGFIDSDDYIAPDMYRLLLERMRADGSDIAACGVEMVFEDGTPSRMLTPTGSHVLDNGQAMESIIRESLLKQPVWYKLYRTDLIRDIPFAVGKYHEDVFWSWQAVARAGKISIFDIPCYYYLQRSGSIMGVGFSLKRLDALEAKFQRQAYLETQAPGLAAFGRCDLFFSCLYMGQQVLLHLQGDDRKTAMTQVHSALAQYPLTADDLRSLPLKRQVWPVLARWNFEFSCKLRNTMKKGL